MPLPKTLWDMFQDWPTLINHSYYSCIWKCIPAIFIWAIWWERNKRIFQNQPSTLETVLSTLEVAVGEVVVAYIKRTSKHLIVIGWDITLANRWTSLPSPSYQFITFGGPHEKVNRKIVRWIPPARGFCKLNFDGFSRGNPGESRAGVCIRDHNGKVLGMLAQKIVSWYK